MATALHSKFCMEGVINPSYKDAHNLLATTIDEFVFLQLLQQPVHPLLMIRDVATVDIPKYSDFKNMFRYVREIGSYV